MDGREFALMAMEGHMRQRDRELDSLFLEDVVPAVDATGCVFHIVVTQAHVDSRQRGFVRDDHLAVDQAEHRIGGAFKLVVIVDLCFPVAALDA